MIEKIKRKLKKDNDHGSSFVLVIVATTFMCILAAALLMGTLMTYKLKFYKLNSLNNFYEVETALDEIYAGVGAATNEHLYSAYTTTAELVVVYDTDKHAYTTMDNDEANQLFKKLFITGFTNDANYKSLDKMLATMKSFISNEYSASNPSGVDLVKDKLQLIYTDDEGNSRTQYYDGGNVKYSKQGAYTGKNIVSVTLKNVTVKRSVTLSGTTSGDYEQSITTDIVLREPEYNVSFDIGGATSDSFYEYAILADMGVEIGTDDDTKTTNVNINGNIYAANDYYNKDYNADEKTKVTTKYDKFDATNQAKWGSTDKSAYSGIFVDGKKTSVTLLSDVIVCPGTLSAYNGAEIKLRGRSQKTTELWADGIVVGGKKPGGSISAAANAYIYDDTELNAENSKVSFSQDSNYFGYSFNAKDTRSIKLLKNKPGYLVSNFKLRSHYSDSAVIVNGKESTLDMKNLNSLYIAGKSYIEFSKMALDPDDKKNGDKADFEYTTLTDYSTGQSLDVKTNQLMFLSQWDVNEIKDPVTGEITKIKLRIPEYLANSVKDIFSDIPRDTEDSNSVLAIKQVVSGHSYYYLKMPDTKDTNGQSIAEKFAEKYYDAITDGMTDEYLINNGIYNVKKYKNFEVKLLLPENSKINASQAVTAQADNGSLFLKKSIDTKNNIDTVLQNIATGKMYTSMFGNVSADDSKKMLSDIKKNYASKLAGYDSADTTDTEKTSDLLSYMYINMKHHLSIANTMDKDKNVLNAWQLAGYKKTDTTYDTQYDANTDTYDCSNSVTPISNFVDMADVISKKTDIEIHGGDTSNNDEAWIRVYYGDVEVAANNNDGSVKGIIIAAGDVRFADNVKSFKGMIICGGKLIIDRNMTISSDESFVANLLDKRAEEMDGDADKANAKYVKKLFKNYVKSDKDKSSTVTGVSISDISYEDILVFQNWKRNVQ